MKTFVKLESFLVDENSIEFPKKSIEIEYDLIGEGRVWCPVVEETAYQDSRYVFKVKGSQHSKSKVKKLASVDIEKMKGIEEFVDKHLSEERLNQGWNWLYEQKKAQEIESLGDYLRWIFNDILKEEKDELDASGLLLKEVSGVVSKKAKIWFMNKVNNSYTS